ncbi:hypothetical protein [Collimonas humicola]|uniref:hypothetical protein n=1 Tax=Collimonas humicola TaxID=2825886 RepID=UPI001B8D66E2|nr:hypothetical protein [Collimonas humicola]
MRFLLTVALVAGILMTACSKKTELWVAKKSTSVYATEHDAEDDLHNKIQFTLSVGEVCTPIREVMKQVYLHTEIQCKSGRGWVIDKQNFDIKSAN